MLIGTAGHIDHGKTTLVRALTGVNTDRLPEERRRGISIELGFAYLPLPANDPAAGGGWAPPVLAFIDVPGHEKFVPTMLAGAAGIDFALLVIAADDGPMPQTREHLDILRLLGVSRGAVVLSKIDRATPEQRVAAEAAIRPLLAGTPFADAPWFPVAAPSGQGVAALRAHLVAEAAGCTAPELTAPFFRLAVDRSFSLAGAGTIVTGTVLAGRVSVGDSLAVVPQGTAVGASRARRAGLRVRSLHVNNRPAETGGRGARCAINLVGVSHHDVLRGDWLVTPAFASASARLDVAIEALPGSEKWLRPGVDLHLHHGAFHGMGRLVPLDAGRGWYQLVAAAPLPACHGDRLVLRDASGRQTLAGARVLDPGGPARHRARPERLAQLAALCLSDHVLRLAQLLDAAPFGVDLASFGQANNVLPTPPDSAITVAGWALAPDHAAALAHRVSAALDGFHASQPDELGLERERLRRIAAPQLDSQLFAALLAHWQLEARLARTGNVWHLPTHQVTLSKAEQELATSVLPALLDHPYEPPWVRELAASHAVDEAAMRQLLRKLAAQGAVFQVVRDLFYHRDAVRQLAEIVRAIAGQRAADEPPAPAPVKAAAFRDATQLGRKRAIQILEFFDRVGYTRRIGSGQQQAHVLRGEAPV